MSTVPAETPEADEVAASDAALAAEDAAEEAQASADAANQAAQAASAPDSAPPATVHGHDPGDVPWVSEVEADVPAWPGAFQAQFGHYGPNKVVGAAFGEFVTASDLNTAKSALLEAVQAKIEAAFPAPDAVSWPPVDDGSAFDATGVHGDTIKVSVYYG